MMELDQAQFHDKRVHLFKETSESSARTWCGLHERWEIWRRPELATICQQCQRLAAAPDAAREGSRDG